MDGDVGQKKTTKQIVAFTNEKRYEKITFLFFKSG